MHSVLILEDDTGTRTLYRTALEAQGFAVVEAATTADALGIARDTPPDLVVADLMLAGGSGVDLCRAVRADAALRATPIVVVTAMAAEAARALLKEVSADAVLIKPIDLDQFTATCVDMLRPARI